MTIAVQAKPAIVIPLVIAFFHQEPKGDGVKDRTHVLARCA
jgi:hypothetical protein